jgi:predicted acyl esterase
MNDEKSLATGFTRRDVLTKAVGLGVASLAAPLVGLSRTPQSAGAPPGTSMPATDQPLHAKVSMKIYGDDSYPVYFRRALPISAPRARYTGFKQESIVLKKGTVRRKGAKPLPCDIRLDRDVAVELRDGTTIYTDVFRPVQEGRYPALVAWSPYGKEIGGQWLDDIEGRSGVALEWVSDLQKFEGPDPAFWVEQGYVVLNPDARGAYSSEGDIGYWGRQLAEDGYDFIEWAAKQAWSDGNLGLSGNSWLAASQWFIAAEHPPHLKAIAPWEGFTDHFRDTGNRGGIPSVAFSEAIIATFAGNARVEDQPRMIVEQQLMSPYWEDKSARLEQIKIPAYVVASYTNPAHTHGSFDGFRRIGSEKKWLRVNNTNEWLDYYTPKYANELLAFFDHFLKNKENNFQATPRVRICVLDPGGEDVVDRVVPAWPPQHAKAHQLFLASDSKLSATGADGAMVLEQDAVSGSMFFDYTFAQDQEVVGYMKLRLWVEAVGSDDMELDVAVEKRDSAGNAFKQLLGEGMTGSIQATGLLRVSQRALDPKKSTASEPYLLHNKEEKLSPGEIVPVDIGIWPMGMRFKKGERLRVIVSSHKYVPSTFDMGFGTAKITLPAQGFTMTPGAETKMVTLGGAIDSSPAFVNAQRAPTPVSPNKGKHRFHIGGKHDSHLLVPWI